MTFPDFTRGHWDEMKGYKHAYASAEEEEATEAKAEAYTIAQKEVATAANLWTLYDNVKNAADEKAQDKALKIYQRAKAKAHQQLAKKLKVKK